MFPTDSHVELRKAGIANATAVQLYRYRCRLLFSKIEPRFPTPLPGPEPSPKQSPSLMTRRALDAGVLAAYGTCLKEVVASHGWPEVKRPGKVHGGDVWTMELSAAEHPF